MSNEPSWEEVNRKLDVVMRLLAYQMVGKMTLAEGAPILKRLGFTAPEIAIIYDSTRNAVNVRLAEAKKKKKANPKGE